MIMLLLLLARALAEDAAPAEAGEVGDIDPEVVEQVGESLESIPTATIRYYEEGDYPADRFPWPILMNALIGLGMAVGGAWRYTRGAPASEVARIRDPRVASIVTGIDALAASIGKIEQRPPEAASDLVVVDAVLLEAIDALIVGQARTNDLFALALERLPELLEES